ncbi:hypothetical protein EDD17DRAFT_1539942 [Pisolithus thermaeus]|nr:hypothetical protein EDD17DRAFT_1539942 [Pisolithus thermaeus]
MKAADQAARNTGRTHGVYLSRCLRAWAKAYIKDHKALPLRMESQTFSRLDDETVAAELKLHLNVPENQAHLGFSESISLKTAQRWMKRLGYRWKKEPKGQYSDGHEQSDVVYYRQNVFLPGRRSGPHNLGALWTEGCGMVP